MESKTIDNQLYQKLISIRSNKNLLLRSCKYLRENFVGLDGRSKPLKLRYYQVQMVMHLAAMNRFLNGEDTGLGKTLEVISTLSYIWEKTPNMKVVVFTNKSAVNQWASEFNKFTDGINSFPCSGSPKQRKKIRDQFLESTGPSVIVIGYRSAVQDFGEIQDWSKMIVVFDEATVFKNPSTQVHQVCRYMADRSERVWGLTATLIKNSLIEGWGIFAVIVPGLFGNKNHFMQNFCITRMQTIPGSRRQIPVITGYRKKDIEEFRSIIDPYYLGRPKFEVASELPPLITRHVKVGMTDKQAEKYTEALSGILKVHGSEKEVSPLTAIAYCQQIVNHLELVGSDGPSEKLDELMDLLGDGGDFCGEKVIIFSRFRKMVDIMMGVLKKAKIKAVRITGSEDEKGRSKAQDEFQNPESDVTVCCITTAASEAINLQAAKAIIFYDTPWSAGEYLQILGRMIRIGSVHDRCYALHLVVEESIDEKVVKVLSKKMELVESVLGKRIKGEDSDIVVDSKNEISDIFDSLVADAKKAVIRI